MHRPVALTPLPPGAAYLLRPGLSGPVGLRGRATPGPTRPLHDDGPAPLDTAEMPWLCWLTGSLALVSLAAMDGDPLGTPPRRRVLGNGTAEGLARLADAAPTLGWSVFAQLQPRATRESRNTGVTWLVLGTHPETTTVIQRDAHAPIALPLTVQLHPRSDGRCEARVHDAGQLSHRGLPDGLLMRVAALSELIDRAWH